MSFVTAVSLAYNEALLANFGATPIKYPVPGYQPLQEIPYGEVAKADVLLTWLTNVIRVDSQLAAGGAAPAAASLSTYLTSNLIVQKLSPLLRNKYIVEACLLRKLLMMRDTAEMHGLLDLFWALLERPQLSECLESLTLAMINGYKFSRIDIHNVITCGEQFAAEAASPPFSTSSFYLPSASAANFAAPSPVVRFTQQKRYLLAFLALTQHSLTRNYLLKHVLFDKAKFALLLDIKPVTDADVLERDLFADVSVNGVLSAESSKLLKSGAVENTLTELESLHQMILDTLIFQDEMCRVMFIAKFDAFLKENNSFHPLRITGNSSSPQTAAPLSAILSFFHRLTSLIRIQYENMMNALPIDFFVDSSCVSNDVTRVGGLFTHLGR